MLALSEIRRRAVHTKANEKDDLLGVCGRVVRARRMRGWLAPRLSPGPPLAAPLSGRERARARERDRGILRTWSGASPLAGTPSAIPYAQIGRGERGKGRREGGQMRRGPQPVWRFRVEASVPRPALSVLHAYRALLLLLLHYSGA